MSNRKWRVVMVRKDGYRFKVGGGISGRGQGTPFVSEKAARNIAADIEESIAADNADPECTGSKYTHCEVEQFNFVPKPPAYLSPLANPPRI